MAYDINYNDERFTEVEADKQEALSEAEQMYGDMINESDKFYQAQIDASKDWADKQAQLQQEQTDFAIEKIEQQKEQEHKDYIKEQSGAYVDWQRQSNPYGVNAEQIASMGLQNSGYAESSQVAMYTAYQNRVAAARESYKLAVLNYDNAIKEAILQNNSVLAEIAYKSLQQQLELSLQSFQYQNSLLIEKANKKAEIDDRYYNRSQNVLAQMNHENALDFQREQFNWQKSQASKSSSGSSGGGGSFGGTVRQSFNNYEEAAAYMREQGVAKGDGGLMTRNEWARRKHSGSTAAAVQYSSYSEYLTEFVAWRMENPQV